MREATRRPQNKTPHSSAVRVAVALAFFLFAGACCTRAALAAECDSTSKGFIPINDLGAGTYQGYQGGLYPGGLNLIPPAHLAAGLDQAALIEPLDALGVPDPVNGWIVLLSVGMCNTSQEYSSFMALANAYAQKNPRVFLLNGAQGGMSAQEIADENSAFWDVIDDRLANNGLSRAQIQAVWFKEANANPMEAFPAHADSLRDQFFRAVRIARGLYPNARLCYFSSRIYAGYASTTLNPEPYAYEGGFAVKWLIESQIDGNDSLNFDPAEGAVNAPWLAWGPYLWADGLTPRSDGLVWRCSDVREDDGTHPSNSGRAKVGNLLLSFLIANPTSTPWFLSGASDVGGPPPPGAGFDVSRASPNPFTERTAITLSLARERPVRVDVVTVSGRRLKTLAASTLPAGEWRFEWDGTDGDDTRVGSGVYFLRVQSDGAKTRTERVTLAR
ncbi:MAG: FlgD immunoglobulin-like domain containing protein [bacterium]